MSKTSRLSALTFAQVHQSIYKSVNLYRAAKALRVTDVTLARYLAKFVYQGHSLTYEFLKEISIEDGAQVFGECYELLMEVSRVDLNKLTLRQVHEAIQQSESISEVASLLGVSSEMLSSRLGEFIYQEAPLTHEMLKGISLENGAQIFAECYELPLKTSRVDLKKLTLSQVHDVIQQSEKLSEAALRLGVSTQTLVSNLGKFLHQGAPLTYTILKGISLQDGREIFGECYDSPMEAYQVDLKKFTLSYVHDVIHQCTSVSTAANLLGVSSQRLESELGKFFHQEAPLTYAILKGMSLQDGDQIFGERYDSPMEAYQVDLKKLTLRHVHNVIQQSTSLNDAATLLGVVSQALERHLNKFVHQGAPLTYAILKGISLQDGDRIFGERYESPIGVSQVDLKKLTLRQVHDVILQSASLHDAASRLGVENKTLERKLGKFSHQEVPISYAILKRISLQDGAHIFGKCYESLMEASRVDLNKLTLRQVHDVIQLSTNLSKAANLLGVSSQTLACHLGRFFHRGHSLTYKFIKEVPLKKGSEIFGARYESPMKTQKVDLSMYTISDIHKEFLMSKSFSEAASRLGTSQVSLKKHLHSCLPQAMDEDIFRLLQKLTEAKARQKYGLSYDLPTGQLMGQARDAIASPMEGLMAAVEDKEDMDTDVLDALSPRETTKRQSSSAGLSLPTFFNQSHKRLKKVPEVVSAHSWSTNHDGP
jgi:transposase-like protein